MLATQRTLMSKAEAQQVATSQSILHEFHAQNGAKFDEYPGGWMLPTQYKDMSPAESHVHTRAKCSLFDSSHMIQTRVHGRDRFNFIESLVVSDIVSLKLDSGCHTVQTNNNGGIVDDLVVVNTSLDYLYMTSCNSELMKSKEREMREKKLDVRLERLEDRALLALQGPKMYELLQTAVKFDVTKLAFMSSVEASVFGIENCRVTRISYTGDDGVEISVPKSQAVNLATQLVEYKKNTFCKLAGMITKDTLRVEAGLCNYGVDIDENKTPVEAGLAWTIGKRRREERNFPGAERIMQQLADKPSVMRIGLKLISNMCPPPQTGSKIFDKSDISIGQVTSGCFSPSLRQNVGMGYVSQLYSQPDTSVYVEINQKKYEAEICLLPFYISRSF